MTTALVRRGSVPQAMAWMIGLSVVLFWLPILGGLIAGFVGGRKAGGIGPAIAAALLPGFVFAVVNLLLGGLLGGIPILGQLYLLVAGLGGLVLSLMSVVPLVIGAIIGAMTK